MADAPPPPPPPTGPPGQPMGPGMRPPQVTAAGVIEIILGSLVLLVLAYILISVGGSLGDVGGTGMILLLLTLVQGVLEIIAGVQVLQLKQSGRILAIVMASIGIVFQVINLSGAAGGVLILIILGIALRVLVIVFLNQAPARTAFNS